VTRYDTIGRTYSATRRADPRIAAQILAALGDATTVLNVGAGTGSYEPTDRFVVAVDPSPTMLQQRASGAAPALLGRGETLPFRDGAFDAVLAVLTLHHWDDMEGGLRELQRVARRQVIFYFEPSWVLELWIVGEYFPEIVELETEQKTADTVGISAILDAQQVEPIWVPADCQDGFGGCFWNRPEAYLDPIVQEGISSLAQLDPEVRRRGTELLARDLESGVWDERHGELRAMTEIDIGYRLMVAGHLS
jgi:ubiquinone/menaquinone biosynthesis C-methylase UbiE